MKRLHKLLIALGCTLVLSAAVTYVRYESQPARAYARSARKLRAAGKHLEALRTWQIVAALDPEFIEAREALGEAFLADGATALAIREFQKLAELAPRHPHVYCRLAEAYQRGRVGGAELEMSRYAARVDPQCARAHRTLGIALVDRQNFKEGVSALERAVALAKDDVGPRLALARVYLGLNQLPEAEAQARQARSSAPESIDAAYVLGHVLLERGDPALLPEAEEALKAAVRLDAGFAEAHLDLGRLYLRQENFAKARNVLEQTVRLAPRNPAAYQHLAEALTGLSETDRVEEFRQRAQELTSESLERLELERQLVQKPLDGRLLYRLGHLLARDGQHLRAIELLERARDVRPDDASVLRRLEEVRLEARRALEPGGSSA